MNTYIVTSAGDGFRIAAQIGERRTITIGGFFSPVEAIDWAERHFREPVLFLPTDPAQFPKPLGR
jgi:hypothetical protein